MVAQGDAGIKQGGEHVCAVGEVVHQGTLESEELLRVIGRLDELVEALAKGRLQLGFVQAERSEFQVYFDKRFSKILLRTKFGLRRTNQTRNHVHLSISIGKLKLAGRVCLQLVHFDPTERSLACRCR